MEVHHWALDDQGRMVYYATVLIIAAALSFFSGRYSVQVESQTEDDVLLSTVDQTKREPVSKVSVVPSPEEVTAGSVDLHWTVLLKVWSVVQADVASLVREKESKVERRASLPEKKSDKPRLRLKAKLALQALNSEAQYQLLLGSLEELQQQIASLRNADRDIDTVMFHALVLNAIVESYKAVGKRWLGFEPAIDALFSFTKADEDEEGPNESQDEADGQKENQQKGEWHQVTEKLPIYALVVRYLRFPPEPVQVSPPLLESSVSNSGNNASFADLTTQEVSTSDTPSVIDSDEDISGVQWQRSTTGETWGECVIASSTDIVEDMVLNLAELIALEYLTCLRNGVTLFPNSSNSKCSLIDALAAKQELHAGMMKSGWSHALRPGLYSSRALERFRNHVLFGLWLHRHFQSVIATFEDYHILLGIRNGALVRRKYFVHRSSDLSKMQGWRLGLSYLLEALDAVEPYLRILVLRIGELLSFLLVTLIGRSLGLILKGIQSSFQIPWGKSKKQ